jgi:hypothetical protein
VTLHKVGTTTITARQPGNSTYYPAVPVAQVLTVIPRVLSVTGLTAADKVYDGTTATTLSGDTLSGVVSGDSVTLIKGTGVFADKNVGTGKAVTVSGYSLSGVDTGNYTFVPPTSLTADITPAPLTITANNEEKDDIDPDPVFTVTCSGFVAGEDMSVVTGLVITREPGDTAGAYAIIPSGATAANYSISFVNGILTIHKTTGIINGNTVITIGREPGIYVKQNPVRLFSENAGLLVITRNPSEIQVMIYDNLGNVIYEQEAFSSQSSEPLSIKWNLCHKDGSRASQGIYLIEARVRDIYSGEIQTYQTKLILKP